MLILKVKELFLTHTHIQS